MGAVTVYAIEARNENALYGFPSSEFVTTHPEYFHDSRTIIRPLTEMLLQTTSQVFAEKRIQELHPPRIAALASIAPQALTRPISYRFVNIAPFDIPV